MRDLYDITMDNITMELCDRFSYEETFRLLSRIADNKRSYYNAPRNCSHWDLMRHVLRVAENETGGWVRLHSEVLAQRPRNPAPLLRAAMLASTGEVE